MNFSNLLVDYQWKVIDIDFWHVIFKGLSYILTSGQIRDVNNSLHTVTQFRLSVRDSSWKPASTVLSRRLLSEAVSNCTVPDNKILIKGGITFINLFLELSFKHLFQNLEKLKSTPTHLGMMRGERLCGLVWSLQIMISLAIIWPLFWWSPLLTLTQWNSFNI